MQNSILVLFAHPAFQKSRGNAQLVRAVRDLEGLTFHDLYEEYPDFNIDVEREKALLLEHQVVVFQHPFYWYSSPALLKEWIDLVLEYGFAYGHGGTALQGKQWLTAITTGGGKEAYCRDGYNCFTIREFLLPFEQTAALCGMQYLPPFVVHGMHRQAVEAERMRQSAADYRELLGRLGEGRIDGAQLGDIEYLNDILEREGKESNA